MKKRIVYLSVFIILLAVEIFIGLFVRDAFIRPYVGDVLVTVLLCVLGRTVLPEGTPLLPVWVFLFSAAMEILQLFRLTELLRLEGTVFGVIIGSTFDWKDILCYSAGCGFFGATEWLLGRKEKRRCS